MDPLWKICQMNPNVLKHIPPFGKAYERVKYTDTTLDRIFRDKIAIHRQHINFEADEDPKDFAEAFLREQYRLNKDGVKGHSYM